MQRTSKPKTAPKAPPKVQRTLPPENKMQLTKDWVKLEKNAMICSGSYSQANKRYKVFGQQGAAVCIVACGITHLCKMEMWTRKTLDDILEVGTSLYIKTKQLSEDRSKWSFKPTEIYKYFFLGAVKVSMKIGIDPVGAKILRDSTLIQKIQNLLDNFFRSYISGVFECQKSYFAVWKHQKFFFIFDPTDHDLRGGRWAVPGTGFCYCLRCPTTNFLADILVKNCPLTQINKFTIYPCVVEKFIKINTTPPESVNDVQPIPLEVTSQLKKPKGVSVVPKKQPVKEVKVPQKKESVQKVEVPQKKESVQKVEVPQKKESLQEDEVPKPTERKASLEPKTSRIPPERPKLQSVTNFQKLAPDCGILRASTHQRDPKFTKYMGAQSFANSIAALTMLRQYKSKVWIRNIVDEVLILGERIHYDLSKLPPGQMVKKVVLKDVEYSPNIERYGVVGRLTSDTDKVLNLEQAVRNMLLDTDCCILIGPQILALWKEDNKYFMFDPEERDASGRKVEGQPGVACVTWFTRLQRLVELYLDNIPKNSRKDRFMINKVVIDDYVALPEDWYNFKALTPKKWILRGTISQQDRRFPPESRNTQCTVNSTMALTYKEIKEEKDWDAGLVDQVLVKGDELYRDCVNYLQETGRFKHRFLMVDEVKRNFDVEDKRVMLEVDDCLVNGILNAKSDTGIPNLRKGFEEFFTESDAGIVTANSLSMAIWKKGDTYYYYDSHSRNEKGIVCGYGTACILRMVTIEDLANALLVNLGPDSMNLYNISRVVVKLIDLTTEGVVKPPLNYYKAVSDVISILRSTTNYKDKKFTISAGKQEVPMCLAALAFNSITVADEWTVEDVDQVLLFGDKLYGESMEANYGEDVPEELNVDEVSTNNVKKEMNVGPNKMYFEFEELASGFIEDNLKLSLEELARRSTEEGNEVFTAILESPYIIASIWRDVNSYFVFDPRPRDERGQVYGKDEWSVKIEPTSDVEPEPEAEEHVQAAKKSEDEEMEDLGKDEVGGGDNLGEPEQEEVIGRTEYESEEEHLEKEGEDEKDEKEENEEMEEEEGGGEEEEEEEVPIPVEKKGSEFWRQKEEEGKSCVLRFSRLEDLITHLTESSPPQKQQELEFSLKRVQVSNTPILREIFDPEVEEKKDEIVGDWNNFTEVDYGKWILRSSRNFRDALFPECNRGRQALPMAMMSIVFAFLYDLTKFNQQVVDTILAYGDRLYTVARKLTIKNLKDNKDLGLSLTDDELEIIVADTKYDVDSYPKKLCMGEKLAKWEVKKEAVAGDVTSHIEEVFNLTAGLTVFFEENQYGVLVCREYPVGVWKSDDFFYMFDPHPTGPSGVVSPVGVSCVTRFKELEHLVDIFRKNIGKVGDNFFYIHSFTFQREACVRKRSPEEKKKKPELIGGFTVITNGKSILRGDAKQDCTKFDRGVHIQSAPVAFVALALSLTQDPDTWTRIIINEILNVGEELYLDTIEKLGDKFDPWSQRLNVCQVNPDFQIGKLKVNSAIRYTEQRGIVDVKNSKVLNLRQGLERFFEENSHGILVAHKFILGIWEQMRGDDVNIFMFDPNSRGGTGLPGQGGVACVMKFANAKIAADHMMACMVDIDKTKTEFSIIPVEIIVGASRTKRKVTHVEKPKAEPCPCSPKKPAPSKYVCPKKAVPSKYVCPEKKTPVPSTYICPQKKTTTMGRTTTKTLPTSSTMKEKTASVDEKKLLRQIAEQERRCKERQRCERLGRVAIHEINGNQAIIRGTRAVAPYRELPANLAAFVFLKIASDLNKWTYKQIEIILKAGDQLYIDSFNTFKPNSPRLTLHTVLRRILLQDYEAKIDIRKPIVGNRFSKENLLAHLSNFFMISNFCMVNYKDSLVSVYFKSGYYFLFDPYGRDLKGNKTEDGVAVLMRFGDLGELVEKVVQNLREPEDSLEKRYALIVVGITSVKRLEKVKTCTDV